MQTSDLVVIALGALIVTGILAISPDVRATANGASAEPRGFGLSGLSRNVTYPPEEDLPH